MKKAYTLIELLLVLALISIISAMTLPNTKVFARLKEKQEVNELRKDLLFIRNRAILEARNYSIYLFPDRNSYSIKTTSLSPSIKTKEFRFGISLSKSSSIKIVQFNPTGSPSAGGTIYLRDSNSNRYIITITPATGRIGLKYEEW